MPHLKKILGLRLAMPLLLVLAALTLGAAPAEAKSCWKIVGWIEGSSSCCKQAVLEPADCTVTPPGYVWTEVKHPYNAPEGLWLLVKEDEPFLQTKGLFYYNGVDADGTPKIIQNWIVSTGGGSRPETTKTPPLTKPKSGVNIDVPFDLDPICGFQITVRGSRPENFYTSGRNPWGNPAVLEVPPGSGIWQVTFGGQPPASCVRRDDPRFYHSDGRFLGLHFGFWTDDAIVNLIDSGQTGGAPCWLIGENGSVPCTGITGHKVDRNRHFVDVINVTARDFGVMNAQIAVAPGEIDINVLTRGELDSLPWEPLHLEDHFLPAAVDGTAGELRLHIPEAIQGQPGYAVLSYDIADPVSLEVLTTVTLEFPLE